MFTLPETPGKYPVGATTFAVPVKTKDEAARIIGRAKLRSPGGGGEPALKLEEVVFTAYYPAETIEHTKSNKSVHWVPRYVWCNWLFEEH